uniref:CID domain-containing protein n=1 Tax=Bionectria ochroleuca TaxID=29856 RepID=A0A0B7JZA8_BIOOC
MSAEAAEVAEDYRLALEDLSANTRFEISNLTVIARENTDHALVISEVLEKHILKTAPSKKLPALYVLDSIVKNVGTPYTLYLGRNIFKTFMEAYTVVDNATRKRMEEMLKTWKQPVAGSMDTRPVFSADLVRPIENALMKAKAAMMPQAQIPGRPRPGVTPHRETPTPPGMRSATGTPGNYNGQMPYPNGAHPPPGYPGHPGQPQATPYPPHSAPQGFGSNVMPFQPPADAYGAAGTSQPVGVNIETLKNDIQNLIVAMRAEFAQNPQDASVQTRLKALLDLQHIVQSTSLPPDQLGLIKNQVTELATVTLKKATSAQNTPSHTPIPPQHVPNQQPSQFPVAPSPVPPAPAASAKPSVTLDSLLGPGAMAALMARQSSQSSTPNPPFSSAAIRSPPPAQAEPVRPASVPNMPAPAQSQAPKPTAAPVIPLNIASLLAAHRPPSGWAPANNRSGINSASLKQQFRPENVSRLYDELGPPCSQCGRRFKTDEEGKKKKMAHMDWHFQVHRRSTEAEKRGTHRSWYEDKHNWVKSREVVDVDHIVAPQDSSTQASKAAAEAAKPKYIPVPDASKGINNVCPICQDKFENKWLDTAQEWVWLDTVLVGNRAYHASCHAEATKDRDDLPRRSPEPILGKRKAETGLASPKVRSLKTSA